MGGIWRRWRERSATARRDRAAAHALYGRLVEMAREPAYYTEGAVPDTNDGRLEMIGLHVALAMRRLGREGEAGRRLSQALVDLLFADIDRNLRELGVGDLSVGKKVKAIAGSFRGRTAALEGALAAADREAVATMLLRNLYPNGDLPQPRQVLAVTDRLLALDAVLGAADGPALCEGRLPQLGQNVDHAPPHP
jgi:cytochrome b pre-mRNA-processing protein 3